MVGAITSLLLPIRMHGGHRLASQPVAGLAAFACSTGEQEFRRPALSICLQSTTANDSSPGVACRASQFEERCAQPGVVLCDPLDEGALGA
jgi:hypothetical protein